MIDIGNKYIHAVPIVSSNKKPAYGIVNTSSDDELATVEYYPGWRCYVLRPEPDTEFNVGCLQSIIKFMSGLK